MKKKAFTLIELLVVVAIIMILAAMIIPAIDKASKKRKGQYSGTPPVIQVEKTNWKIGDTVVINGINKTGVINYVDFGMNNDIVTIITTEGTKIESVNSILLRKIYQ